MTIQTARPKGSLVWALWGAAALGTFAFFEGRALRTNRATLSRAIWDLSEDWAPTEYVFGFLTGALATHFYWHWSPPGSVSEG